jgi:hypothetical protein
LFLNCFYLFIPFSKGGVAHPLQSRLPFFHTKYIFVNLFFEKEKTGLSSAGRSRSKKNAADAKLGNPSLSTGVFQSLLERMSGLFF